MSPPLALLMLLACACALPPRRYQHFHRQPLETFTPWHDYDEYSESSTYYPRLTQSAKVILRAESAKVNKTVKNNNGDSKKKTVKSTTINIESHTNFVVTKRPNNIVISKPNQVTKDSQRPGNGGRPLSTRRPPSTQRAPSRQPTTQSQPLSTTKLPVATRTQSQTLSVTPKILKDKNITCPPKHSGWLSSFFEENKVKKASNINQQSHNQGFLSGVWSQIYGWVWGNGASWFANDESYEEDNKNKKKKKVVKTTTTTFAPSTSEPDIGSWFQTFLKTEEKESNNKPESNIKKKYKGYQLLRAYTDVQWKVKEMLDLKEESQGSGLMWWTLPSVNGTTDLLVPPDLLSDVKDHLRSAKIQFETVIKDLRNAIKYENPRLSKKQRLEMEKTQGHPMTWRRYHRYADILRYLEYLQHAHADLVELVPLGRSSQGLPLVAVKVAIPSHDNDDRDFGKSKKWKLRSRMKPALWIDGGTHAREWIAPAVATWILRTLVEGDNNSGKDVKILKHVDFYIMPVLNPDGYEHSHRYDRLWVKTRSQLPEQGDDYYASWFPWNWGKTDCIGVNADRNWDYHFGEIESSKDSCSENYAGPHPFSEPETQAVSDFLLEHRGQIKVFLTLHAYQQAWMVPSAHGHSQYGVDPEPMEMGKLAVSALSDLYGTKYKVATAADMRQSSSGMAHDWASRAGIKYSYHVELPESIGQYGFLLPGSQIVATARETWQAIKTIVHNLS